MIVELQLLLQRADQQIFLCDLFTNIFFQRKAKLIT